MSTWSHLSNAQHIDAIIADVKANPEKWNAAWDAVLIAARDAARSAAATAATVAATDAPAQAFARVRDAARYAAWDAARSAARYAVWDAMVALIAWDECSYLLEMKPDQVKVQALLGNHAAVLMLPAVIALNVTSVKLTPNTVDLRPSLV